MAYKWVRLPSKTCTYIDMSGAGPDYPVKTRMVLGPHVKRWIDNDYYYIIRQEKDMKRRATIETPTPGAWTPSTDPFLRKLPNIDEVLANPWYEDGGRRDPGNLKITITVSGVQLILTDPTARESAFTTAKSVREALELLEGALEREVGIWRPWPAWMGSEAAQRGKKRS